MKYVIEYTNRHTDRVDYYREDREYVTGISDALRMSKTQVDTKYSVVNSVQNRKYFVIRIVQVEE